MACATNEFMARKKKFFDDDFFGEDLFEIMEEMLKSPLFRRASRAPDKSVVKGVRVSVGPDGKTKVQKFGDSTKKNAFEPWVDVINGEKNVTVIAELPGVIKEELELNAEKDELVLEVKNPERPVYKKVGLPAEVKFKTAKAKLKNGLLEVILEKKAAKKKKEKKGKIKVS
jgi:HSP20 family protein